MGGVDRNPTKPTLTTRPDYGARTSDITRMRHRGRVTARNHEPFSPSHCSEPQVPYGVSRARAFRYTRSDMSVHPRLDQRNLM